MAGPGKQKSMQGGATVRCQQVRVELAAYSLGGLDPADRETVEVHLADCPESGRNVEATSVLSG